MISKITSRHIDPLSLFSGDASAPHPQQHVHPYNISEENPALKGGPLHLLSKGIGWSSWKKRWFVLTRTSLVFFRTDPNAVPQKGSELNLTLGGIDLNNSGSVVVKEDKKLLTVLFPDGGREGRAFTLKADTLEDLHEWKRALENALAEAPDAPVVDESDTKNGSAEQTKDKQPAKSTVIGRPILLALEEVDGTPSFLEKALRFIEEHGYKVEGILRQAADVEHVERRIREYEQGKTEFSPGEDAHVIADCVKYIMRELPSYPVPASCCKALLEACRKTNGADRNTRINAMRVAICETFPEPNRRLLQRILIMMQAVVSHKNENLMGPSAVAACMAPILLRALMSGDCEIENDFDVGGDGGSMQLMQAAAAANHAQAIAITLLEEYDNIFGEGSISSDLYDSEETGSEGEEATDDDESYDDDGTGESDAYSNDDNENGSRSDSYDSGDDNSDGGKGRDESSSGSKSPEVHNGHKASQKLSSNTLKITGNVPNRVDKSNHENQVPIMQKSTTTIDGRNAGWGRAPAKRNHSMESIDYNLEDENDVQNLEATKAALQDRASKEVEGKDALQATLDKQKNPLDEHRLDLVQEVGNLRNTLLKEKNTRIALEAVLKNPVGPIPDLSIIDEKTKAEIQELAQEELSVAKLKHKVDNLGVKLKCEQNNSSQDAETSQHREMSTKSTSLEGASTGKPPNFKRSNTRAEGGTSASTHTKLTTRLKLLKERRNQIASEIHNVEKGEGSDQSAVPNPENREGSDQDSGGK